MAVSKTDFDVLCGEVKLLTDQLNKDLLPKMATYDAAAAQLAQVAQWKTTIDGMVTNQAARHDALFKEAKTHVDMLVARMATVEQTIAAGGGGKEGKGKGGWQMTRPKDLIPNMFDGKEDEWANWKESVEDYIDKIKPCMKQLMTLVLLMFLVKLITTRSLC